MTKTSNNLSKLNYSKSFNKETIFSILKKTPEYVFVLDSDNNIVFWNDNVANFAQIPPNSHHDMERLKRDCDIFYRSISRINTQTEKRRPHGTKADLTFPEYIKVHNSSGEQLTMSLSHSVHDDKEDSYRVVLLCDHTNISKKERRLTQMASVDHLTKAYNRRYIMNILEKEFFRFVRNNSLELSIMFLDLDFFKKVNDNYGHHAGDSVLIDFSNVVIERLRKYDNFGRMGGEEFCISLTDTNAKKAGIIAHDLLNRIRSSKVKIRAEEDGEYDEIQYTCSIGIASLTTDFKSVEEWLDSADKALYFAKNNGRDQYCHFSDIKEKSKLKGYSSSLAPIPSDGVQS